MEEKIYTNILDYLISKDYVLNADRDLYLYALKILFRGFMNVTAVLIMGLLLGMLKESIFMFFSFFLLRKFAGGLHSDKYINCFISSLFISIFGLLLIKNFWFVSKYLFITIMISSSLLIIGCAPVKHPNKTVSNKEAKVFKIVASTLSIAICILSTIMILSDCFEKISYSMGTGIIISSVLMICGKIKYS